MEARKPEPERKRSRWSLSRLLREPLRLLTCRGEVTLAAERKDGRLVLLVEAPPEDEQRQP